MTQKIWRVCGVFDTETCNIKKDDKWRAYPVAYIFNDLRNVNIKYYKPDVSREKITILRTEVEAIQYLQDFVDWHMQTGVTPIICAYNLMFDLQTLLYRLANEYELAAIAQSATNAYTVDLLIDGEVVLRFWDTFHLEMGGLSAMGETCGFSKALGDWDYSLIRTPETPLTEQEIHYASVDVQVIPAYLRWLCEANEWLQPRMLGNTVLTKTSLLRQFAKAEFKKRRVTTYTGQDYSLFKLYQMLCTNEEAKTYWSYALRKACFRGGFTFTSAANASQMRYNVHSIDVVSMHHVYITGRRLHIEYKQADKETLQYAAEQVISRTLDDVLRRYDYPFFYGLHVKVRFTNLRLKKDSVFDVWKIALLASSKVGNKVLKPLDFEQKALNIKAEQDVRDNGWHDSITGGVLAFGKVVEAETITSFLTEVELWNVSRVYDFDSMEVLEGEISTKTTKPPDYVTLQSNLLFERKSIFKDLNNNYHEGEPYAGDISHLVPEGIADGLRTGKLSNDFLQAYYASTVKGQFNSIYGSMCMLEARPDFMFDDAGNLMLDRETSITPENYADRKPDTSKVLYTYGMRIVAGSRQHLIIAIELLYNAFGDRIQILGGDTDSLKVSTSEEITPEMLLETLKPLEDAIDLAILRTMERVRRKYPDLASELYRIGHFDYEETYKYHVEGWNKARVSCNDRGEAHITCAGLMRPHGVYHIENWINDLLEEHAPENVLPYVLGYNGVVSNSICHALENTLPATSDMFNSYVTDYLGNSCEVSTHEAIALYPGQRLLASEAMADNVRNLAYLAKLGVYPEKREHVITLDADGNPALWVYGDHDLERIY